MAAIPPNWLASNIQSTAAQSRAAEARNREQSAEPVAHPAAVRDLTGAVENEGRDGSVYSDSEGSGSQGRSAPDDTPHPDQHDSPSDDQKGESTHVDVEA